MMHSPSCLTKKIRAGPCRACGGSVAAMTSLLVVSCQSGQNNKKTHHLPSLYSAAVES